MSVYKLRLRPGGIIPPAIELGILMQSAPAPVEPVAAVAVATGSSAVRLPAGADNFVDASIIDITEGLFLDRTSEYTYVKDFTRETNEPSYYPADSAEVTIQRTAWWKFFVPAGKRVWVDVDAKLSFGKRDAIATAAANTWMNIYTSDVPEPVGFVFLDPLVGMADVGPFSGFPPTAGGFDPFFPNGLDAWNFGWYPEMHNVHCDARASEAGQWFWIQIGDEFTDDPPHAFVLRMSITEHATDDDSYPKWVLDGREPDA